METIVIEILLLPATLFNYMFVILGVSWTKIVALMLKLSIATYLSICGKTELSIFCCILHLVHETLNLGIWNEIGKKNWSRWRVQSVFCAPYDFFISWWFVMQTGHFDSKPSSFQCRWNFHDVRVPCETTLDFSFNLSIAWKLRRLWPFMQILVYFPSPPLKRILMLLNWPSSFL